ncbi:MAG: YncE family protein [Bacteroidales bacterium]|nr:YncE family protein [Bacteroidales bacterium]MDD3910914.1 YncE family protein [Bacteroidales bacterium]MDD4420672.1 YncE family protein [Bacteroidales bacterium]
MKKTYFFFFFSLVFLLSGCRGSDIIVPSTPTTVDTSAGKTSSAIAGMFLLNEGNMGSNKATLDYYNYNTGVYHKNIFATINPLVSRELGDVGNDIQIYGGKLYAVINCSHYIEVMDVRTAKHIAAITIPNCRYIVFNKGYAYISSYAGPVLINPNARLGYVARMDTTTFKIDTLVVGYQPEEMVISGDNLYVANSGGYRVPNYDRTVSVIDLNKFKVTTTIDVAINLHRMEADEYGNIYVSSRGDYYTVPSSIYVINSSTNTVTKNLHIPCSEMTLCGDSLYVYSTGWSYVTNKNTISYTVYNTKAQVKMPDSFIKDGTEKNIVIPYGIAVNPITRDIFVTDAKDYVTPGTLYCFSKEGKKKWSVTTGDIPAHMVFTTKKLQNF